MLQSLVQFRGRSSEGVAPNLLCPLVPVAFPAMETQLAQDCDGGRGERKDSRCASSAHHLCQVLRSVQWCLLKNPPGPTCSSWEVPGLSSFTIHMERYGLPLSPVLLATTLISSLHIAHLTANLSSGRMVLGQSPCYSPHVTVLSSEQSHI